MISELEGIELVQSFTNGCNFFTKLFLKKKIESEKVHFGENDIQLNNKYVPFQVISSKMVHFDT